MRRPLGGPQTARGRPSLVSRPPGEIGMGLLGCSGPFSSVLMQGACGRRLWLNRWNRRDHDRATGGLIALARRMGGGAQHARAQWGWAPAACGERQRCVLHLLGLNDGRLDAGRFAARRYLADHVNEQLPADLFGRHPGRALRHDRLPSVSFQRSAHRVDHRLRTRAGDARPWGRRLWRVDRLVVRADPKSGSVARSAHVGKDMLRSHSLPRGQDTTSNWP